MKKNWKKLFEGFTLVEMLVVLLVISVLVLIFIPNIAGQREKATEAGNEAVVKVVETQMEMYRLDKGTNSQPTGEELVDGGYIKQEQWDIYEASKK